MVLIGVMCVFELIDTSMMIDINKIRGEKEEYIWKTIR